MELLWNNLRAYTGPTQLEWESIELAVVVGNFEPRPTLYSCPAGGGHAHMLADIICLSIDTLFYANLTPK